MARRFIVNNIVNLIKDLGGNPNKFIGTKSNISFLGKGPKQALLQGQVDIRSIAEAELPIERVISEAETAGGYAVANKLNDIQLQRLEQNLIELKKLYFPEPVANITDLGTGTRDLTAEGLGSLRTRQLFEEHFPGRSKDASTGFKNLSDELAGAEGKLPRGRNPRMTGDENLDYDWVETPKGWVKKPGSEGAFYRFGEKNKEFIDRSFLLNREKIRAKYQGLIDDDLLNNILADNNPQRIAEVLATIDEALLMQGKGMNPESIIQSFRDTWGRKKSASGGLAKILEV